jgi:hypothetical protein
MALLFKLTQTLSAGFSALWARYPNKNAKKDAEKAYGQVVTTPEIDAEVNQALDWQIPHWRTMEWYHPPYLATYLRKERFRDEKPTMTPNRPIAKAVIPMAAQQMDAAARIKSLIAAGVEPEEAKRQVYREMGWIKE